MAWWDGSAWCFGARAHKQLDAACCPTDGRPLGHRVPHVCLRAKLPTQTLLSTTRESGSSTSVPYSQGNLPASIQPFCEKNGHEFHRKTAELKKKNPPIQRRATGISIVLPPNNPIHLMG
jgi:hypothetical protein